MSDITIFNDPTPSPLVAAVRRLTGAGTSEYRIADETFWSDEQLLDAIDMRVSARLIQAPVDLIPSRDRAGQLVFTDGRVRFPGTLDVASASVVDWGGQQIDGATIHADGRVAFETNQATTVPLLSGLAYDLYGAGADVLTSWASAVKGKFDIAEDGQTATRSQIYEQLVRQATELRARAVVGTVHLGRSDVRSPRQNSPRTAAAVQAFDRIIG